MDIKLVLLIICIGILICIYLPKLVTYIRDDIRDIKNEIEKHHYTKGSKILYILSRICFGKDEHEDDE